MQTKICNTCGKEKPLSEFHIARANSDGHDCKCKVCKSEYNRKYHAENRDRILEWNRKWRAENKDHMRELNKRNYRKNIDKVKAKVAKRNKLHPERIAACHKVNSAIMQGEIVRPNKCDSCGVECKPDAHHYNYDNPLEVTWLCRSCHLLVHRVEGNISVHQAQDN